MIDGEREGRAPESEIATGSNKVAEASVEGRVVCIEGPVPNSRLSLGSISTFTDEKGNFLFEHVPPGISKLTAESPTSRFCNHEQGILIEAGECKKDLTISLTEVTGTIEGLIKDEAGMPIIGAEVSGLFRLTKPIVISKTDDEGHYIFYDIPPGSYRIRANSPGYMTDGTMINVTGGSTTALVNFTLGSGHLSLSGNVRNKQQMMLLDSEICLMRNGTVVSRAKSVNGKFMFNDLVSDTYEMEVLSNGYTSRSWKGYVEKSETLDFELEVDFRTSCSQ